MTLRELIIKSLQHEAVLDEPVLVRIVRRNSGGTANSVRLVPINYLSATYSADGQLQISVEQSAIDAAVEKAV